MVAVLVVRNELAIGLGHSMRYIDEFQDVEIEIAGVAINADLRTVLQYPSRLCAWNGLCCRIKRVMGGFLVKSKTIQRC
ncbi:MAG: hypothetical protein FWE24_07315 [Defluviitaleaceae bacterium]|nr:hypothetical protein [Defluviitaleaceae bacterium]